MQPEDDIITQPTYSVGMRIYRTIQVLVTLALAAAMGLGWQALNDPEEFPINSVKVQATFQHVDRQALQQAIVPELNHSFFNLNTGKLEQNLMHLPWVAQAKVERLWPDGITVTITEQQATAQWGAANLINSEGELFSPPTEAFPPHLPVITGPEGQAKPLWQLFNQITALLQPLGLKVTQLTSNDHHSVSLLLNNGTKILIGRKDSLPRLQRFVKVYPEIFKTPQAQAESIDLRYDNGLSVKWQAEKNDSASR